MAIRMTRYMTRRAFGATAGALLLSTKVVAQTEKTETPLLSRPIPGSGERIPAVGLGTAYVFDVNNEVTRSKADAVIQALVKNGGRLIDTASTYGDAESVLGEVTAAGGLRDKLFIATKLEISRTLQGVEETRRVSVYWHHFDIPPGLSRRRGRAGTGEARFRPDRLFTR